MSEVPDLPPKVQYVNADYVNADRRWVQTLRRQGYPVSETEFFSNAEAPGIFWYFPRHHMDTGLPDLDQSGRHLSNTSSLTSNSTQVITPRNSVQGIGIPASNNGFSASTFPPNGMMNQSHPTNQAPQSSAQNYAQQYSSTRDRPPAFCHTDSFQFGGTQHFSGMQNTVPGIPHAGCAPATSDFGSVEPQESVHQPQASNGQTFVHEAQNLAVQHVKPGEVFKAPNQLSRKPSDSSANTRPPKHQKHHPGPLPPAKPFHSPIPTTLPPVPSTRLEHTRDLLEQGFRLPDGIYLLADNKKWEDQAPDLEQETNVLAVLSLAYDNQYPLTDVTLLTERRARQRDRIKRDELELLLQKILPSYGIKAQILDTATSEFHKRSQKIVSAAAGGSR